ncbi:MAG: sulfatase [Hyphomicrobiales bacterium]|nr:sulfatase [Hyphomicrobiales bacterium]MCP5000657.1 sulfatase [Hyphomicrobiales bacterium]
MFKKIHVLRNTLQKIEKLVQRLWLSPIASIVMTIAGISLLYNFENQRVTLPFAVAIWALIAALLFVASKRLSFSVGCAWMIVGAFSLVSLIKFQMKGFSLHIYDLYVAASDLELLKFITGSYMHLVAPVVVILCVFLLAGIVMFRMDRPSNLSLPKRLLPLLAAVIITPMTYPQDAYSEQRYFYYLIGRHSTAFFVSLLDLQYAFGKNKLEKSLAAMPAQPPFNGAAQCGAGNRPDIFVVLEESHTDPALFTQLENRTQLADRMRITGETMHPLNVEMFGGGTWISGLSFLTGLSALDFGWRSPYLTTKLENAVGGAIPQILTDCGYRTVAMLPLGYTFVNEGPFLNSIGFETVLDGKAVSAPSDHMRDSFYFGAAEKLIEDHRANDGRPLFVYLQTMFPHSPYYPILEPEVEISGAPFHPDTKIDEYLRRLLIARADYADFRKRAYEKATQRGLVTLSFGDHQTYATMPLVVAQDGENALARPGSLAYRTYYTLSDNLPRNDEAVDDGGQSIDIGFLGVKLLQAAGIPGSDVFVDLAGLADMCGGAYYACPLRDAVDRHLRRRIDGGLLDLSVGGNS